MDLICISDNYEPGKLAFWKEKGVSYPIKDKMYVLRNYVRHSHGEVGIRVEEIVNPEVLVKHSVLGTAMIEPTFHCKRFATLQGDVLTLEMIKENSNVEV